MARNLKAGEQITVDKTSDFDPTSESYGHGLARIEPGQAGIVVSAAPQGRASIVEFNGVQATLSNRQLTRIGDIPIKKNRGRKKRDVPAPKVGNSARRKSTEGTQITHADETQMQLVTTVANTLLLNGGLKDEGEAVIQIRFADLPESVKFQIRTLIEAKLALSRST